jgi:hypothetical protein
MAQGRPMMRGMETIGALLDAATDFAARVKVGERAKNAAGHPAEPHSGSNRTAIARALLAEHLRNDVNARAAGACDCGRTALLARLAKPGMPLEPLPVDLPGPSEAPDLALVDHNHAVVAAFSVHYGWWPDRARDELDRLLHLLWRRSPGHVASPSLVGHVFVHETRPGEIIRETERGIDEWLGASYGPFNGLDRIHLPMSPRIVRTGTVSPPGGALSKIDGCARPTGYAAFALVCEADRY